MYTHFYICHEVPLVAFALHLHRLRLASWEAKLRDWRELRGSPGVGGRKQQLA